MSTPAPSTVNGSLPCFLPPLPEGWRPWTPMGRGTWRTGCGSVVLQATAAGVNATSPDTHLSGYAVAEHRGAPRQEDLAALVRFVGRGEVTWS